MARDERLAKRPVHVVLRGELNRVEAAKRVLHASGADLEPCLVQHAAEGHDVTDERVAGH